ncbi:MAG TPA: hypothetical protein VFJ74_01255 [Gemmatimonadaceae bacterium]|nr:hypothetical protein [Gemmatimonadaceae bacterium]
MPSPAAALRFPHERVLLPRTKLAYVHLRNLLTDAKRDRAGRVSGYVAIWLPDELVLLYLQRGEVVNATTTHDARRYAPLPIAEAIAKVPAEPELGEICFHEANDEQLAAMYAVQCAPDAMLAWPAELDPRLPEAIFPYLASTTFDGVVEIASGGLMNYLVFQDGAVQRGFLADGETGPLVGRVQRLFSSDPRRMAREVRHWPPPPPLPTQASPALIQTYRDLMAAFVQRLITDYVDGAPAVAESARERLRAEHPALDAFAGCVRPTDGSSTPGLRAARDTIVPAEAVTEAAAAWVRELLWASSALGGPEPEVLLREVARDRRHVLQSQGFFDLLPWKVAW